jgi:hypothetical protein
MKHPFSVIICLSGLMLVATAGAARAQAIPDTQDVKQPTTLTLKTFAPAALPKKGGTVTVNGSLVNPKSDPAYEVRQTLKFPIEHLQLTRVQLGVAGEIAGATMTVEYQNETGAKVDTAANSRQVSIVIKSKSSLPAGPLEEFRFIQTDEKEQTYKIQQTAEVRDSNGTALAELTYPKEIEVRITKTLPTGILPVFSCFFYMH